MEPVREQILNLQHISYTYHTLQGETLALSDISFSLKKGEFAAIVGPSGCGKSTLLSLICGLLPWADQDQRKAFEREHDKCRLYVTTR